MSNVVDQNFQKKWNGMIIDLASGKNSGFHMTVLSQLRAVMTTEVNVAATDGLHLFINPIRWGAYSPSMRLTILIHELWHVIGEHPVRGLEKEHIEVFGKACDYVINDMLAQHDFKMNDGLLEKRFTNLTADEVYKILADELPPPPPSNGMGQGKPQQSSAPCDQGQTGSPQNQQSDDIENSSEKSSGAQVLSGGADVLTPEQGKAILDKMEANGQLLQDAYGDSVQPHPAAGDAQMTQKHLDETVMQAYMQEVQNSSGEPGMFPADLRLLIDKLTKPVVPWYIHLRKYMQVFVRKHFSYSRLRKQYQPDFILPSLQGKELSKIASAFDISGSVTDEQVMKFNSEMAFIQNKLKPKELEIVSFDTRIHDRYLLKKGQKLNGMEFHGRGGTSLTCVFDHFNSLPRRKQPKLLIVFSDLFCAKITKKPNFDVIWICFDNPNAEVDFGKLIHVDSENDYK